MAGETSQKSSEIFENIWTTYQFVENTEEASNSETVQKRISSAKTDCITLIDRINELRLFSTNEDIEEVATEEIRYMLLSGLMGYLLLNTTTGDRLEIVQKAQNHYLDFLRLLRNYSLSDYEVIDLSDDEETVAKIPIPLPNSPEELKMLSNRRERKIKQYKEKKETDTNLNDLYQHVQKEHVDDEVKRKYYLTLLKKWRYFAEEELDSIKSEIPILQHMAEMRKKGDSGKPKGASEPKRKTYRPFILTRNEYQKAVLGAGYRSLPTYTVEQWYEMEAAAGRLPKPEEVAEYQNKVNDPNAQAIQGEKEDLEKEAKLEKDDEEELMKARNWDDWKDDHRRGWGNRQNMG